METYIAWITGIIAAASAAANLTPTDKDNKVIAVLTKFINLLALNIRRDG